MSTVYNPEADMMAEIEWLELEARDMRRKVERVVNPEDRRVMQRLLMELKEQITRLQGRLP